MSKQNIQKLPGLEGLSLVTFNSMKRKFLLWPFILKAYLSPVCFFYTLHAFLSLPCLFQNIRYWNVHLCLSNNNSNNNNCYNNTATTTISHVKVKSCWRDQREGVWMRQVTWWRKQGLVSMSCHYESRAAHLKLTPNNLEEEQGKKKNQTQKEAIQYTLLFKKAGLPWNCFSAHERALRERHPTYPETPRDTWRNRSGQKSLTEAKEEGRFGDSRQEKEAATQLNHLRYRWRRLRWEARRKRIL